MTNVLVVDDERSLHISLREILRDAGHNVDVAEDADEALAILGRQVVDVVVSDIIMPRISGVALLKAIKDASPDVQVILMTGEPTVETASDAVRAGAFDYLAKPVPPHQLLTAVANAARLRELEHEQGRLIAENLAHQHDLEELVAERTAALKRSEQQYRLLAENSTGVIWTMNERLELTYVSPAVQRLLGYSAETAMRLLNNGSGGESFDTLLAVLRNEFEPAASGEYDSGRVVTLTLEIPRKEEADVWGEVSMRLLFDDDGVPVGVLGTTRDISERKRTERLLGHAQRMEAMGHLTSGIAHDFNNILGIILGNLDLLQMRKPLDADIAEGLDAVQTAAQRAVTITDQLLGFSRRQTTEITRTDLNTAIDDLSEMIAQALKPRNVVEYDLGEGLWLTEIDSSDFGNALLNLTINARDAMSTGGVLLVRTANSTIRAGRSHEHGVAPGDYVQLMVSDEGSGMTPEVQERIFEPFYSTKPHDLGTGLGLSLVFGFVQRSGGHIHVSSRLGTGTIFTVYLPRSIVAEAGRAQ